MKFFVSSFAPILITPSPPSPPSPYSPPTNIVMPKSLDPPVSKKRKIDSSKTPVSKDNTTKDTKKHRSLQKKPSKSQLIPTAENKDAVATVPLNVKTFEELSLLSTLLKPIFGLGTSKLSPVQQHAIPALLGGRDVGIPLLPLPFMSHLCAILTYC
jgi:hypothetical protein